MRDATTFKEIIITVKLIYFHIFHETMSQHLAYIVIRNIPV